MKSHTKAILIIFSFQLALTFCFNKSEKYEATKKTVDTLRPPSHDSVEDSMFDVINVDSTKEFKDLFNLLKGFQGDFNKANLKKVEKVCRESDGELSEYFNSVAFDLFEDHYRDIIKYLSNHSNSWKKG